MHKGLKKTLAIFKKVSKHRHKNTEIFIVINAKLIHRKQKKFTDLLTTREIVRIVKPIQSLYLKVYNLKV